MSKRRRRMVASVRGISAVAAVVLSVAAASVSAQTDAPAGRYIVRSGDTLWGISADYLQDPLAWRALWEMNRGVRNPNLIFPGDALAVPAWRRGGEVSDTVSVAKADDTQTADIAAKPSVSVAQRRAQEPFYASRAVVSDDLFASYARVTGFSSGRLLGRRGDQALIDRPLGNGVPLRFYRREAALVDPASGQRIGVELRYLGKGELVDEGGVSRSARVRIDFSTSEVYDGDVVYRDQQGAEARPLLSADSPLTVLRKYDRGGHVMSSRACKDSGPGRESIEDDDEVLLVREDGKAGRVSAEGDGPDTRFELLRALPGFAYLLAKSGERCLDVGERIRPDHVCIGKCGVASSVKEHQ